MSSYRDTIKPPAHRADRMQKLLVLGVVLGLCQALNIAQASPLSTARPQTHTQPARKSQGHNLSIKEIENSLCLIPNLGSGDDYEVHLKNGHYQRGPAMVQGREEGRLSNIATGELNGKACGAALLTWSTGGTGVWKNLILFQKKNKKVRGTQAYDLAYPLNKGRVTALKIAGNNLFLDLADIPLAARLCANDGDGHLNNDTKEGKEEDVSARIKAQASEHQADEHKIETRASLKPQKSSRTITKEEALNALVYGPSQEELNGDGSVSRSLQLKAGRYASRDMSCKIEQVLQTKLDNEPLTLAAGQIKYTADKPPVFIAFSLKERQGKVYCDGCYTLSSEYFQLDFQKITALKLENTGNGPLLQVSLAGIKIKPSEFTRASYLKN